MEQEPADFRPEGATYFSPEPALSSPKGRKPWVRWKMGTSPGEPALSNSERSEDGSKETAQVLTHSSNQL
jgi:hypothetical protein